MVDTLRVLQWNAARSLAAIQSITPLLTANNPPHILLIQEPPWYQIGSQPSLTDPDGTPILNVPSLPGYTPCLPPATQPRVVTYISRDLPTSSWSIVGAASYGTDILTIEIRSTHTVRLCNYYGQQPTDRQNHHPRYPGELFLESLPTPLAITLTVAGDFNRRHHSWSDLTCSNEESRKGQFLDDIFRGHGHQPAHPPDLDSRPLPGASRCPIDMVWAAPNLVPELICDSFASEDTGLSDHLRLTWEIPIGPFTHPPRPPRLTNEHQEDWCSHAFPPLRVAFELPATDHISLDNKALAIQTAMAEALQALTKPRKHSKKEVPWWSPQCATALAAIKTANTARAKGIARRAFKRTVRAARRHFYSEQVADAAPYNIWSWAKRGLGIRPTPVPSLKRSDGSFTTTEEEKGELFKSTYFPPPPPLPVGGFGQRRPPPTSAPPILLKELKDALAGTSNLSAPGLSGVGYRPLKWVVESFPNEILTLFNDCLRLGHHPQCWRAAKVVMLRKPNKKDPFSPRSYRPITLEETLGKLLEKIIANRLQYLSNTRGWLPPNQFGGRQGHSVYDAAQRLLQIVEKAQSEDKVCSILAVDIQGFFDSVHPHHLHQRLLELGCSSDIADWCLSFMTSREVAISFDGTTLPSAQKPDLGTPQGSPISPILSTLFAGIAIQLFNYPGTDLLAYVDDHLIVMTGNSVLSNCRELAKAYHQLDELFGTIGLKIEATKTELLHFHPPRKVTGYHGWDKTGVKLDDNTIIRPSIPLRWLGIWWDPALSFKPHVERMRSKGLSTLAAIRLLANTERGMSSIHLRQLYSACVRTVLTWGVPVWYTGNRQKTLVARLQAVQNTACRWILGVYRGASPLSTNFLCSLPPFEFYFNYLKSNHALRLWRTPHSVGRRRITPSHRPRPFSTSLPDRVPKVQQVPAYTHEPWVDPLAFAGNRLTFAIPSGTVSKEQRKAAVEAAQAVCTPNSIQVCTDGSRLEGKGGSAIVALQGPTKLASKLLPSPARSTATDGEINALTAAPTFAASYLHRYIMEVDTVYFLSDSLAALRLVQDWPSAPGAHQLLGWKAGVQTLLDFKPDLRLVFQWCPGHSGIKGNEWADEEAKKATELPADPSPPSISALKEEATNQLMAKWSHYLTRPTLSTADKYLAVSGPPSRRPHPLITMSTSHPRSELSAVAQVLCAAGPYGGYWLRMSADYRHRHGLISHCRWHNHPPWPAQTTAHILGGCETFQPWIQQVWPKTAPQPAHHSEWADRTRLPVLRKWLKATGHLTRPSARSTAAIKLAFATMELDGHPTDEDMDLATLRVYVRRALGPRTQDADPDLYEPLASLPSFPPEP